MKYILFYSDRQIAESEFRASKASFPTVSYPELDDALGMSRLVNARGGIAWEIVGSDGKKIERAEISHLVETRAKELRGRPRAR
ncbi:MAG TPA: hypothetical protein VMC10_17650 [Stellaceae bacterium]|nr:hypothetical protein [Stellaceae bacterium]